MLHPYHLLSTRFVLPLCGAAGFLTFSACAPENQQPRQQMQQTQPRPAGSATEAPGNREGEVPQTRETPAPQPLMPSN